MQPIFEASLKDTKKNSLLRVLLTSHRVAICRIITRPISLLDTQSYIISLIFNKTFGNRLQNYKNSPSLQNKWQGISAIIFRRPSTSLTSTTSPTSMTSPTSFLLAMLTFLSVPHSPPLGVDFQFPIRGAAGRYPHDKPYARHACAP